MERNPSTAREPLRMTRVSLEISSSMSWRRENRETFRDAERMSSFALRSMKDDFLPHPITSTDESSCSNLPRKAPPRRR